MDYPLRLNFKLLTLGQRITVTDASGNLLLYVKQKMFKLREKVELYADAERQNQVFTIAADRMIDFSANYSFADAAGNDWGSVRRRGMRSLWAAHYEVMQDGRVDMEIREESAIKNLIESVLSGIPLVGPLAVYLINPSYIVRRPDGTELLRLIKRPAIFEGRFDLQKLSEMPEDDEMRSVLALLMMVLLERRRG